MKRSDNIAWSQVRIGIFVICALLFMAAGVILMGKQTKLFVPKGEVTVIMMDVAGLKVGAPVWLAGVDVGLVSRIRFENPRDNNAVEIVLEVDREAMKKIGTDSVITVKTRGLMGEKYVDVTPSSVYSEVPAKRLHGTPVAKLDDVMQKAGSAFDHLNTVVDKMNRGEGTLGKFATDPKLYNQLVGLTAELSVFSGRVNQGEGTLGKLYRNDEPYERLMSILNRTDTTLRTIQSSDGTLNKLIYDRALYDKLVSLADTSAQAAADVRELNRKLTSPDSTVGKLLSDRELYDKASTLLDRADKSVKSVEEVAARVNRGEGSVGKALSDRELYDKMNSMVDNLDALVKDFKENPRKYIKFSIF
jgi:phospholipid/cholesterol/gamma-HCH transport system substrate-binding protein